MPLDEVPISLELDQNVINSHSEAMWRRRILTFPASNVAATAGGAHPHVSYQGTVNHVVSLTLYIGAFHMYLRTRSIHIVGDRHSVLSVLSCSLSHNLPMVKELLSKARGWWKLVWLSFGRRG